MASTVGLLLKALLIVAIVALLNEVAIPLVFGVLATYVFMNVATDVMSLPLVRTFALLIVFVASTGLSYWLLSTWLGGVPTLASLTPWA